MNALPLFTPTNTARAEAAPYAGPVWRPVRLVLTATQKWLLPLGVLAFDVLFWQQGLGLNLAIYTLLAVLALLAGQPRAAWRSGYFRLVLLGALVSCGAVAWYGSATAALACTGSLLMLWGYANQPPLKQAALALLTGLGAAAQVVTGLPALLLRALPSRDTKAGRAGWYVRLLLVPVLILGVFHMLFVLANPRYSQLVGRAWQALGEWLGRFFELLSLGHLLFLVLGLMVTAAALLRVPLPGLAQWEARFGELVRRRRDGVASFSVPRPDFRRRDFRTADLRKEYLAALAVFGLVNLLLLAVNAIDISWIWIDFRPEPGFDLAQFVHEGTYVLIFSILLAMGIVLWFFRRNLNFYQPGLPVLRWGATVWVLQNAVLAVSVGVRNYHYISRMGLAYKRIGVCFFLLLTLFGLLTILLKIWQRRSAFALVRLNSVAAYLVLLALAVGNWEVWIVRYNLTVGFPQVDYGFLLDMPGRVLPALVKHRAILNRTKHITRDAGGFYSLYEEVSPAVAQRMLDERVRRWQQRYQAQASWQDWNYMDWRAHQQLPAADKAPSTH
ncbi:DUF4153 domain-containing protein [Hymenobacter jeollabukensis]|uniref:DUF4173 domain-containing protein n=1 Tax=Hymenobacter jeollabukensis TaxID=2025313 RepID=A0A5R8WQQ5_9BACT|nr:DUF4173 domain-containing protein [Hymenobacter jeollabukensis]TLM92342.1 DUF4173 domain-containing protein [Hymenobacter jeollabukensis]